MRFRAVLFGLQLACLLGLVPGCFSTAASEEDGLLARSAKCITPDEADRLADRVLQLVNLERASASPPRQPVVVDERLRSVAEEYACRMVEQGFFGHEDPITGDGASERAVAGKYLFHAIGENLAAGQKTAAEVMTAWMESESHRAVILDHDWKQIGIAVRGGGEYAVYWVQEFGDPVD